MSASDRSIAETADDTIDRAVVLNLDGRSVVAWPVRRIGALRDDTVEFLANVSNPSFYCFEIASAGGEVDWR